MQCAGATHAGLYAAINNFISETLLLANTTTQPTINNTHFQVMLQKNRSWKLHLNDSCS